MSSVIRKTDAACEISTEE